jgi:hypothetical protein
VELRFPIRLARSSRRSESAVTKRDESTRKRSSTGGSWRSSSNRRVLAASCGFRYFRPTFASSPRPAY